MISTWKLHLYCLASMWLKILCMLPDGKSHYQAYTAVTLLAIIRIGLERYMHWCNSGLSVGGVTNYFLIGFKACSARQDSYLKLLTGPQS